MDQEEYSLLYTICVYLMCVMMFMPCLIIKRMVDY